MLIKRKFGQRWFALKTDTNRFGIHQSLNNKKDGDFEIISYIPKEYRSRVREWQRDVKRQYGFGDSGGQHTPPHQPRRYADEDDYWNNNDDGNASSPPPPPPPEEEASMLPKSILKKSATTSAAAAAADDDIVGKNSKYSAAEQEDDQEEEEEEEDLRSLYEDEWIDATMKLTAADADDDSSTIMVQLELGGGGRVQSFRDKDSWIREVDNLKSIVTTTLSALPILDAWWCTRKWPGSLEEDDEASSCSSTRYFILLDSFDESLTQCLLSASAGKHMKATALSAALDTIKYLDDSQYLHGNISTDNIVLKWKRRGRCRAYVINVGQGLQYPLSPDQEDRYVFSVDRPYLGWTDARGYPLTFDSHRQQQQQWNRNQFLAHLSKSHPQVLIDENHRDLFTHSDLKYDVYAFQDDVADNQ